MRISDWSSDVCSSDLNVDFRVGQPAIDRGFGVPPGAAAIIRATTTTNTFHARARLGSNRVMDTAKLVERVKSILLSPKSEWPVIAAEPATVKGLYTGYFMIRSEEHTSELQSLMRNSYAAFCLKKKKKKDNMKATQKMTFNKKPVIR